MSSRVSRAEGSSLRDEFVWNEAKRQLAALADDDQVDGTADQVLGHEALEVAHTGHSCSAERNEQVLWLSRVGAVCGWARGANNLSAGRYRSPPRANLLRHAASYLIDEMSTRAVDSREGNAITAYVVPRLRHAKLTPVGPSKRWTR